MKTLLLVASLCAFFSPAGQLLAQSAPKADTVVWFDLETTNLERAREFYGKLFGWSFESKDYQGMKFDLIKVDGKEIGDICLNETVTAGDVSIYFPVKDLRKSYALALSLGAESVFGPMAIPEAGRGSIAKIKDPDGHSIGLFSPKPL